MAKVQKVNRLTLLYYTPKSRGMYKCICGTIKELKKWDVEKGKTCSCGCYLKERRIAIHTKHGLARHPLYNTWKSMIDRCHNPKNKQYPDYGARGVTVCEEWRNDFMSYYNWAMSNGWEQGLHIDKDMKGDGLFYSPETCCCISRDDNNNKRRSSRMVIYDNKQYN